MISKERRDTALMQVHSLIVMPLAGLTLGRAQTHFPAVNTHLLDAAIGRLQLEILAMDESLLSPFGDPNPCQHGNIIGGMLVGFVGTQQQAAFL